MTGDRVFRVLLRMQAAAGRESDFESAWLEVGALVASQPGNRGQWLMRGHDEPGVFYVMSDWVDEAHFRDFEHGDVNAGNRRRLQAVRTSVAMTTMRVVRFIPRSAHQPTEPAPPSQAAARLQKGVP
jgi:heme oxygenase (mycobilin-producing)